MPCYRCGTRQVDPEPGKPSPYRRGVVGEHQVLICQACQPAAAGDLTRCRGCGSVHLIRRLDQIECLDCRLIRDAGSATAGVLGAVTSGGVSPGASGASPGAPDGGSGMSGAKSAPDIPDISPISDKRDSVLAAEVARALERMRRTR
jgi:hypothetical protein